MSYGQLPCGICKFFICMQSPMTKSWPILYICNVATWQADSFSSASPPRPCNHLTTLVESKWHHHHHHHHLHVLWINGLLTLGLQLDVIHNKEVDNSFPIFQSVSVASLCKDLSKWAEAYVEPQGQSSRAAATVCSVLPETTSLEIPLKLNSRINSLRLQQTESMVQVIHRHLCRLAFIF